MHSHLFLTKCSLYLNHHRAGLHCCLGLSPLSLTSPQLIQPHLSTPDWL